jgi:hypothetical protein
MGLSLLMIVFIPFLQGGLIGMSTEALDGHTSLETFVDVGKANYVRLLVAYLALLALNLVLGFFVFIAAVVGGFAFFLRGSAEVPLAVLAIVGIVGAIVGLVYLVISFFVQFYGHAIVLDDLGPIEGFKRSIRRVRHNLVSVAGYTVLVFVLGGLAGAVFGAGSWLTTPETSSMLLGFQLSLPLIVVVAVLIAVIATVAGGFFGIYSVAFYRRLPLPDDREMTEGDRDITPTDATSPETSVHDDSTGA